MEDTAEDTAEDTVEDTAKNTVIVVCVDQCRNNHSYGIIVKQEVLGKPGKKYPN